MKNHTEVHIHSPKLCDFCNMDGNMSEATVDGKTIHGPWANMCDTHFKLYGVGLGLGKGQKLIVVGEKE